MSRIVTATPLISGNALATAQQPTNVALAQLVNAVNNLHETLAKQTKQTEATTQAVTQSTFSLGNFAVGMSKFSIVAGIATHQFSMFTNAVESGIASAVAAFNPAAVKRWELTVRDLHAVFGEIFLPILEKATIVVRALADGVNSLSPSTKTMIAALAVAAISMATMTAITAAFSAAVATATGGLSLAIGAVVGGISALGMGAGTVALTMEEFQDTIRELGAEFTKLLDELGPVFVDLVKVLTPAIKELIHATVEIVRLGSAAMRVANEIGVLTGGLIGLEDIVKAATHANLGLIGALLAVGRLAGAINEMLGIGPAKGIGGSEGKAIRNVRFGSTEDAWREAVKASFSLGSTTQKPEERTAKGIADIWGLLNEWDGWIKKNITGPAQAVVERHNRAIAETPYKYLDPSYVVDRLRQKFD